MSNNLEIDFEADAFKFDLLKNYENEDKFSIINMDTKSVYQKAEEFFSLLESYFDSSKEVENQTNLYFDYIIQIPDLFKLCFCNDSCTEKELRFKNLQAAFLYLKALFLYLESPLTTDASKAVIHTSFTVLQQAYIHCKDSEAFYGECFDEFTNELGKFYKNIQEVQNATLKILEELLSSGSYHKDADNSEILLVLQDVAQLCISTTSLEKTIAVVFWKIFTKMISQYKDIAQKKLEINIVVLPLLSNISDVLTQCICNIEVKEQVNESEIKMCLVELCTLKKILIIFKGCLKDDVILGIRNIALLLYKLLIQSYSHTAVEVKDLNIIKILLKTVRHVIVPFFSDELFFKSAFHCAPEELPSDLLIPLVLLKLAILDYSKSDSESKHLLESDKVLNEVFSTLKASKPEHDFSLVTIQIPYSLIGEIENGTPQPITLYQHCYVCLTQYSRHISSSTKEEAWLNTFNSCSDVIFLLISDVLIFYSRCGSVDRVFQSCKTLSEHLGKFNNNNSRLELILIRMIHFLPKDYKIEMFQRNKNLSNIFYSHNAANRFSSSKPNNAPPETHMYCDELKVILHHLTTPISSNDYQKLIKKACSVIEMGRLNFERFPPAELLKFIEFAIILFKSEISDIQMAIVSFCKDLKNKTLSKNKKELDELNSIFVELLTSMLKSKNYIIKLDALSVYFSLASSHPQIVKKVAIKHPDLIPSIKSYLEKTPSCAISKETKFSMCLKQLVDYQLNKSTIPSLSEDSKTILSLLLL